MPFVSIIIATSGRTPALRETLNSIQAITIPDDMAVELVLVENGLQNGARELLQRLSRGALTDIRYCFEPARGKSRALNLALAEASGDILLFTDDDVRFPVNWILGMCEPIVTNRADAVAGGVKLAAHLLRPWMNRTHRAWLASTADYLSQENPSEMCGANMAVSRRVFDRIGGFDPQLGPGITGGGEESLLSWRLKQAGFKLVAAPDVQVEHHPDPARLRYQSWINAASLKGQTRGYLKHHWFHQEMRHPRMLLHYYRLKLLLRRACSRSRKPDEEGIPPWELSYIESISECDEFIRQRPRPRKYPVRTSERLLTGLRSREYSHE